MGAILEGTRLPEALCLVELLIGLITCLAAWEMARRFIPAGPVAAPPFHPQLIIAATGPLPGLETLREALDAQTVPIGSLWFAVESEEDPAFCRIETVFRDFDPPVGLVVAGLASVGGQKSRNLAAALQEVDETRPVVLADADIVPQANWLATLLRPIRNRRADIVTGYRWPLPLDGRLPTLLICWMERAIAALPKPIGAQLIWGGSVALAPGLCTRLELAASLEPHISDDLFLATLARRHRLRVRFPAGVLLPTPTRHDWRSMIGFGRRQYQMIRLYSPLAFAAALATAALNLLGTAIPLVLLTREWWAAPAYLAMAGVSAVACGARRGLGSTMGIPPGKAAREGRICLLCLILPLVHLAHLLMIFGALRVRTIRWGRYTYRMRGKRVAAVETRWRW